VRQTEKNTQQQQILQQFNKKALLREKICIFPNIYIWKHTETNGKKILIRTAIQISDVYSV
jgi:hypothetical protein